MSKTEDIFYSALGALGIVVAGFYTMMLFSPVSLVGQTTTTTTTTAAANRRYNVVPVFSNGAYVLSERAANLCVWRNGLRQQPGIDYSPTAFGFTPLASWVGTVATDHPADEILVDYDFGGQ